jgi:hypothetical protein
MWRWIIRTYVSLIVFVLLLFISLMVLKEAAHALTGAGFPWLAEWFRAHILLTAFLTGLIAGQAPVDSRLTGEGWFRSKDGKTFEGFRLEELRRWTWLLVAPLFMLGVVFWCLEQSQLGVLSRLTISNFYNSFLMPKCADVWARGYYFNNACNMQFLFVASWTASIGYSAGPIIRRAGQRLIRGFSHSSRESGGGESGDLMKKANS